MVSPSPPPSLLKYIFSSRIARGGIFFLRFLSLNLETQAFNLSRNLLLLDTEPFRYCFQIKLVPRLRYSN